MVESSSWRFSRFTGDAGVSIATPFDDPSLKRNLLVASVAKNFIIAAGKGQLVYGKLDELHSLFPKQLPKAVTSLDLNTVSIPFDAHDLILSSDHSNLLVVDTGSNSRVYVISIDLLFQGQFNPHYSTNFENYLSGDPRPNVANEWLLRDGNGSAYILIDNKNVILKLSFSSIPCALSWHPTGSFLLFGTKNEQSLHLADSNGTILSTIEAPGGLLEDQLSTAFYTRWVSETAFVVVYQDVSDPDFFTAFSCNLKESQIWTAKEDEICYASEDIMDKRDQIWYSTTIENWAPEPVALVGFSQSTDICLVPLSNPDVVFDEDFYECTLPLTVEDPEERGPVGLAIDILDARGVDEDGKQDTEKPPLPILWVYDFKAKLHGFHLYCSDGSSTLETDLQSVKKSVEYAETIASGPSESEVGERALIGPLPLVVELTSVPPPLFNGNQSDSTEWSNSQVDKKNLDKILSIIEFVGSLSDIDRRDLVWINGEPSVASKEEESAKPAENTDSVKSIDDNVPANPSESDVPQKESETNPFAPPVDAPRFDEKKDEERDSLLPPPTDSPLSGEEKDEGKKIFTPPADASLFEEETGEDENNPLSLSTDAPQLEEKKDQEETPFAPPADAPLLGTKKEDQIKNTFAPPTDTPLFGEKDDDNKKLFAPPADAPLFEEELGEDESNLLSPPTDAPQLEEKKDEEKTPLAPPADVPLFGAKKKEEDKEGSSVSSTDASLSGSKNEECNVVRSTATLSNSKWSSSIEEKSSVKVDPTTTTNANKAVKTSVPSSFSNPASGIALVGSSTPAFGQGALGNALSSSTSTRLAGTKENKDDKSSIRFGQPFGGSITSNMPFNSSASAASFGFGTSPFSSQFGKANVFGTSASAPTSWSSKKVDSGVVDVKHNVQSDIDSQYEDDEDAWEDEEDDEDDEEEEEEEEDEEDEEEQQVHQKQGLLGNDRSQSTLEEEQDASAHSFRFGNLKVDDNESEDVASSDELRNSDSPECPAVNDSYDECEEEQEDENENEEKELENMSTHDDYDEDDMKEAYEDEEHEVFDFEDYSWDASQVDADGNKQPSLKMDDIQFAGTFETIASDAVSYDNILLQAQSETATLNDNFEILNDQIWGEEKVRDCQINDLSMPNNWKMGNNSDIAFIIDQLTRSVESKISAQKAALEKIDRTKKSLGNLFLSTSRIDDVLKGMKQEVDSRTLALRGMPLQAVELKKKVDTSFVSVTERVEKVTGELSLLTLELSKRAQLSAPTTDGIRESIRLLGSYGKGTVKSALAAVQLYENLMDGSAKHAELLSGSSEIEMTTDNSESNMDTLRETAHDRLTFLARRSRRSTRLRLGKALREASAEQLFHDDPVITTNRLKG